MSDTDYLALPLVEGRGCGDCVACCVTPAIDTPELKKPPNTPCPHCTGSGCAIYEARPPVCSGYYCFWRVAPFLDESWRPDLSGVILFTPKVPGRGEERGLDLVVTQGEDTLRRPYFARFVGQLIREGRPVFLTINNIRALINPYMEEIARQGDAAVLQQLLRFHAGATTHRHARELPQ